MFVDDAEVRLMVFNEIKELKEKINISPDPVKNISKNDQLIINCLKNDQLITRHKLHKEVKETIRRDENAEPFSAVKVDESIERLIEKGIVLVVNKGKTIKYSLVENHARNCLLQNEAERNNIINEISLEQRDQSVIVDNNQSRVFNILRVNATDSFHSPERTVPINQEKIKKTVCILFC